MNLYKYYFQKRRFAQRLLALAGVPVIENDRKLLALRSKHEGERCFIVGNGPSLVMEDLDAIRSEYSFASNHIGMAYDKTVWRPTYYTAVETEFVIGNPEQIEQYTRESTPLFHQEIWRLSGYNPKALYYHYIWPESVVDWSPDFGSHPLKGIHWGSTCTYNHLQFAFYMGFKEIYLIGMDCNYPGFQGPLLGDEKVSSEALGSKTHFHPDYGSAAGYSYPPNVERHLKAFKKAAQEGEKSGVNIINVTRGGCLEVFPRLTLEDVLA